MAERDTHHGGRLIEGDQATALAAGDFAASAGFGATPTVAVAAGSKDQRGEITVTPGGAGIAADPTITLTFKDGTFENIPFVVCSRGDNVAPAGGYWAITSRTLTTVVFTFVGTPVAASVYRLAWQLEGGKN